MTRHAARRAVHAGAGGLAVVLGVTAFVRDPGWLVTIFYQD
jgi:hypothetical protein